MIQHIIHHQYKYQEPHGVLISGNTLSILATKTDNTLWSWGYGGGGKLGQNDTIIRSSPVQIPGTSWSSISSGHRHSLATKTDGTSMGMGSGSNLGRPGTKYYTHISSHHQYKYQEPHGVQ
jgi:hypothetical protein